MSEENTLENVPPTVERTPTILVLDTSGSMGKKTPDEDGNKRKRIEQLNDALSYFKDEIKEKNHAETRVDVAVVTFGGDVNVEQDFTPIENWSPPTLTERNRTPMGKAIEKAIDLEEDRKSEYHENGYAYNRPIIWLLTDGEPTDMEQGDDLWNRVQKQLNKGTADNHFLFFAFGIGEEADMDTLNALVSETDEDAYQIGEGQFKEYFRIVSNSLEAESEPGEEGGVAPDQVNPDSN